MANPVTPINLTETLSTFLGKAVSDGTQADVVQTAKVDAPGLAAPATLIKNNPGELWANLQDDMFLLVYQALHLQHKVWSAADTVARDALGSDNGLAVDDLCYVVSAASMYRCTAVTGPATSTWALVFGPPAETTVSFLDNIVHDEQVMDLTTDEYVIVDVLWRRNVASEASSARVRLVEGAGSVGVSIDLVSSPSPVSTSILSVSVVGTAVNLRFTGSGAGDTIDLTYRKDWVT